MGCSTTDCALAQSASSFTTIKSPVPCSLHSDPYFQAIGTGRPRLQAMTQGVRISCTVRATSPCHKRTPECYLLCSFLFPYIRAIEARTHCFAGTPRDR